MGDGKEWSLFVLNDDSRDFGRLVLHQTGTEWGDCGIMSEHEHELPGVVAGGHRRVSRENDDEMRMWFAFSVEAGEDRCRFMAEFPKLYRRKYSLPVVERTGLPGIVIAVEPSGKWDHPKG